MKGIESGYSLNELNTTTTTLLLKKNDGNVTGKLTLNEMGSDDWLPKAIHPFYPTFVLAGKKAQGKWSLPPATEDKQ